MVTATYCCFFVVILWLVIGEVICAGLGEGKVEKSETTEGINLAEDQGIVAGKNKTKSRTRVKRYPEHLDPNYPFWVRIGECPSSMDGNYKEHFCPTPTPSGRWVCVDDYQLCDGIKNCPNAEDEASNYCLFYKVLKSEVEMLQKSISTLRKENGGQVNEQDLVFEIDQSGQDTSEGVGRFRRQSGQFAH